MLKIEYLGEAEQNSIIESRARGLSYSQIAKNLSLKTGKEINKHDIIRFFNKRKEIVASVISRREDFKETIADSYMKIILQIMELSKELWRLFYELKEKDDKKSRVSMLRTADILLKQLVMMDNLRERFESKDTQSKVNVVELTEKLKVVLPKILRNLENSNKIKILDQTLLS